MKRFSAWGTLFLLVPLATTLVAQTASVTLLGHLDQKHGQSGTIAYSACWGYTAPDGREYALLGTFTGCAIIDITDAANPREVVHIAGASSIWKEMKVYKNFAYVVSEGNQGVQIIDLSGLPATARLDTTILSVGGFNVSRNHTVSLHDGYLYLNGSANASPGGIIICSLANPRRPQYLGRWATRYTHDSYVRNDTIFSAAINNGMLDIIDARNKSNPTLVASIVYPGAGTHNAWTTKDRRYVVTTDEIGTTTKDLKVWDIRNLPTVSTTPVARFTATPADIEHNVFIRGDYAYTAWYTAGLRVADITDPVQPIDVGGYDTSTETPGSYNGMWGAYPFFPSGKIIGSDMQNGLWIFSFTGLAARRPVALLEPANRSTIAAQDSIRSRWSRTADLVRDPHTYQVRLFGPGLDTTWRSNDSTGLFTNHPVLTNGAVYSWQVTVLDEFNVTASRDTFQFTYRSSITGAREPGPTAGFALTQNYPNPFNPSTRISFALPVQSYARLELFDVSGKLARLLVNTTLDAGVYQVNVDARDLASGVYFYRLSAAPSAPRDLVPTSREGQAGTFVDTKKLILMR